MNTILDMLRDDPNIAPAFKAALPDPMELRRSAYVAGLRNFDWLYRYSDDGRVYRTAKAVLEVLQHEQRQIDPDFVIWDQEAPIEFWHGEVPL